jgi:predicted TIM-barrel fold metal-dependent hydrolase
MGDILSAIEDRRIPLFTTVSTADGPDAQWTDVEALLRDFPRLTLCVMPMSNWGQDRYCRPLVERFERLYVGIESYELAGGIAEFTRRYGSDRLLFGSGYPRVAMGGARSALARADIAADDRRAIARGNLERILREAEL